MVYFTSDLHFGHENVLQWRPVFSSVEEMDETLIRNWNDTVKEEDFIIILGDMFFQNQIPAEQYLQRLKGRKILVRGNHDASWLKHMDEETLWRYFEDVVDLYSMKRDGVKLQFCHYPMISWESSRRGSLLICGHIHGRPDGYEYDMLRQVPNAFNAGVDINGFRPVALGALIQNNDAFYCRSRSDEERQVLEQMAMLFDGRESE